MGVYSVRPTGTDGQEYQVPSLNKSGLCACAATVDFFVDNQIPLHAEPYPANQERLLQTGYDKIA